MTALESLGCWGSLIGEDLLAVKGKAAGLVCTFLFACFDSRTVACESCQLSAKTVAILRADTGDVVMGESSVAVQFGAGYVALNSDRTRLLQFSSTGDLLRVAGHAGRGPGELHNAGNLVALDENTLLVSQSGHYLVFDSTLIWQRTMRAPGRYCMYGLPNRDALCVVAAPDPRASSQDLIVPVAK